MSPDLTHSTSERPRPSSGNRCVYTSLVFQSSFYFLSFFAVKRLHKEGESEFDPLYFSAPPGSITSGRLSVRSPHSAAEQRQPHLCCGFPSFLLPSDGAALAGPGSTRSINGSVRKRRGLCILTWMDAWGSFHFGWQGSFERLFVSPFVLCKLWTVKDSNHVSLQLNVSFGDESLCSTKRHWKSQELKNSRLYSSAGSHQLHDRV